MSFVCAHDRCRRSANAASQGCEAASVRLAPWRTEGARISALRPWSMTAVPRIIRAPKHAGAGWPLLAAVDGEMLVVGGTGPVPSPSPAGRSEGRDQDPAGVGHPWPDVSSVDVGRPSGWVNARFCLNVGILKS